MGVITQPVDLPPNGSIKIEVSTKLEAVKIKQLALGGEYPSFYSVLEYFPSLAEALLKRRLSFNSETTCSILRHTDSTNDTLRITRCQSPVVQQNPKGSVIQQYLTSACLGSPRQNFESQNKCNLNEVFLSDIIGTQGIQNTKSKACRLVYGLELPPSAIPETTNRQQTNTIRQNYIARQLAYRNLVILKLSKRFTAASPDAAERQASAPLRETGDRFDAGFLSEFLYGGNLPSRGSDGSEYKLQISRLSNPKVTKNVYSSIECDTLRGQTSLHVSNIQLAVDFRKKAFHLSGIFEFKQTINVLLGTQ